MKIDSNDNNSLTSGSFKCLLNPKSQLKGKEDEFTHILAKDQLRDWDNP